MGKLENLSMLSAKVSRFQQGAGGIADLEWQDVAGALAYAPHAASELVHAMYLHDPASLRRVTARLKGAMVVSSDESIVILDQIARVAVQRFISPPLCPTCNGRGQAIIEQLLMRCDDCEGTGYKAVSDAQISRECGVTPLAWNNGVETYFHNALDCLHRWHDEAMKALSHHLE